MMLTRYSVTFTICLSVLAATPASFGQTRNVTINVIPPLGTPDTATIRISGNVPELGEWYYAGVPSKKVNDTLWTLTRSFPTGTKLEFKVTRGSWYTQAIYSPGVIPPNTALEVRVDTIITLRPLNWNDMIQNGVTGSVRYHHNLSFSKLRATRDVIVWLPPRYEKESGRRYPVLYMHDGQNIFDPSTSYTGYDWRIDELADSLITKSEIEEIIVVGIYNSKDRMTEYSGGRIGRNYAEFIVTSLKPFIDATYRTRTDRENTAVMGSSMGGLISFYLVWWHPEVFSKAACLSSAFSYDPAGILDRLPGDRALDMNVRIFLDCGDVDIDQFLVDGNRKVFEVLKAKGIADVELFIARGGGHNEREWAKRVWRPLVFLFGPGK